MGYISIVYINSIKMNFGFEMHTGGEAQAAKSKTAC
jgi:hypothetical protein